MSVISPICRGAANKLATSLSPSAMRRQYQFLTAFSALLLPLTSVAAESAAPDMSGSVLRLVFGFAFVLALLFATLWVLKKISVPRGGAGNLIRVVSAAAVGPRERVVLVDVGGKRLVLGVAPGQVTLLDTQAAPAGSLPPQKDTPMDTPATPAFAQWLQKTLAKRNEK